MNRLAGLVLGLSLLTHAIGRGAELSVTVQDSSASPLPGLPVTLSGPNDMYRRVVTDSQGLAFFQELEAGSYGVATHMEEAYGPAVEGEIRFLDAGAEIEVHGQERISLILTSSADSSTYCEYYWSHCVDTLAGQGPAVLLGTLMRDGKPMRGSSVCLEQTARKVCDEVDERGRYALGFDLGTYSLSVYEGETTKIFSVEKDFFEERTYFDQLSLPNSSDAGMILAGMGDQVAPASCFGSALSLEPEGGRVDAHADPDGELRFYNLAPGDYEIRLECEGYPLGTYSPIRVRPRSAESYGLVLPNATDQ